MSRPWSNTETVALGSGSASFKVIYIINNSLTSFFEQQVDHRNWAPPAGKLMHEWFAYLCRLKEIGKYRELKDM